MAILSVYILQCLSNSASDGSSIPLVDGYPIGLHTEILVEGYLNGFHTVILVNSYPNSCRGRIPAAAGAADAMPSGVSRVRVTRTVLRECDLGLHRTVTVDSHRRHTDTGI